MMMMITGLSLITVIFLLDKLTSINMKECYYYYYYYYYYYCYYIFCRRNKECTDPNLMDF